MRVAVAPLLLIHAFCELGLAVLEVCFGRVKYPSLSTHTSRNFDLNGEARTFRNNAVLINAEASTARRVG